MTQPVRVSTAPGDAPTVVLTRSPDRANAMAEALEAIGARVLLLPLLDFEQVPLDVEALRGGAFRCVVFSSITTVRALKAANGGTLDGLIPQTTLVATIGPSSQRVLEAEGVSVDIAPEGEQSAEGLIQALSSSARYRELLASQKVWLPQSDVAATTLQRGFESLGARVIPALAYKTVDFPASPRLNQALNAGSTKESLAPRLSLEDFTAALKQRAITGVVLASPSAAMKLAQKMAPSMVTGIVAIGNPTARAASEAGFTVARIASSPTPEGVAEAFQAILNTDTTEQGQE